MEKKILFKTNKSNFAYAISKYLTFCECIHNYAKDLNYRINDEISIKYDNEADHSMSIDHVSRNIDLVSNFFIDGIEKDFDEVPYSFPYHLTQKIMDIVNYQFDLRTMIGDKYLDDKHKSCDIFHNFLIDSSDNGFINVLDNCLDVNRINISRVGFAHHGDDGGHIFMYHIIDNIDIVINITTPTIDDGVDSERYSNCLRFEAKLVVIGEPNFNVSKE